MGPQQPGKAVGASTQQIYRQLQLTINEALRVLDAAHPLDPANQAEVDSLRSLIWSELTGLEAEFGREEGPRADRAERFFHHLLSNGDYVGQIEALGSTLLGGAPPSQPPPDSPVAGLHQLHSTLAGLHRQWQQMASAPQAAQPTPAPQAAPSTPASAPAPEWVSGLQGLFLEEVNQGLPDARPANDGPAARGRRVTQPRSQAPAARKPGSLEQLFGEFGLGSKNGSLVTPEAEAPRPRVLISFVTVFLILALMGVGVIYLGLSSGPDDTAQGQPLPTGTITVGPLPSGTAQATATLDPAPPQLQVLGNPLLVPCPSSGQTTGFLIENTGGGVLTWQAQVHAVGVIQQPVTLDSPGGQLSGLNRSVTVSVTAQTTKASGLITITSNVPGPKGSFTINYQIAACS
jgi:hypothetical protein